VPWRSRALISTTSTIETGDAPSLTPVALGRDGVGPEVSSTNELHSWHVGQQPTHFVSL